MISPVFPRIQVNDTEKGTIRVPPRNKLAMCNEQLSTIPSSYGFGLPPSISSIHGYGGYEKNIDLMSTSVDPSRPYSSSSNANNNREMKPAEPLAFPTSFHQLPWVPSYGNLDLKQQVIRNQSDPDSVRLLPVERPSIRTSGSWNVRRQTHQLCTGSSTSDINVDCCVDHYSKARSPDESSLAEASGSNSPACSSSVIITPDHVMNVMGEKQFWLTRRAIMNQQRMFAAQVFELHRLVRVQRLMARSPDLKLKSSSYPTEIEQGENSPRAESDRNGPPPGTCLLQAGNQWLVPVMSPSEGLIYKPYSGTLPACGFMVAPFYPECGAAMSPPYGMVANSPPHHHRSSRFTARGSKEDVSMPCRSSSSSNMPTTSASLAMMKGRSDGGSTNAVLPLFPLAPTKDNVETCDASYKMNREQRVIKVIPRNPRLATESVAKIFDLIQEERKRKFNQFLG